LKRRQRHRWAGQLSCEKPTDQDADSIPSRRKAIRQPRYSRVGRAQTKENIVPHMRPTQGGKRMSQGLDGVRKAAKERKQERFTALLHHLSVDLLRDSFYALQRKASPGVDGVTWQEYETGVEDRLIDLHNREKSRTDGSDPKTNVSVCVATRQLATDRTPACTGFPLRWSFWVVRASAGPDCGAFWENQSRQNVF
jgi:hypothetical protein